MVRELLVTYNDRVSFLLQSQFLSCGFFYWFLVVRWFQMTKFQPQKRLGDLAQKRLVELEVFFTKEKMEQVFLPLVFEKQPVSLRALDWLVTNYAKKFHIVLAPGSMSGPVFNIFFEYISMLRFWKRPLFDPFRRSTPVFFHWNSEIKETTVAQLNFVHWVHSNGVLDFARDHAAEIEQDMKTTLSVCHEEKEQAKAQGQKRKRHELNKPLKKRCLVFHCKARVEL